MIQIIFTSFPINRLTYLLTYFMVQDII